MSASLLTNLPKLRWYQAALTSNIGMPYMIICWTDEGISLLSIMTVVYISQGITAALEIHTGHLADRWSHKASLAIGGFLGMMSSLIYATTASLGWILVGACLMAIAQSCCSGANSALGRASCIEAGRPEAYERLERRLSGDAHLGEALGALLAMGMVVLFGLTSPFLAQAGAYLGMFILALTLKEAHKSRQETKNSPGTLRSTIVGLRHRHQLMAAIVFSGALGASLALIPILAPMYYQSVHAHHQQLPPVEWFGLLWCGYLMAGWGFSYLCRRFVHTFGVHGAMAALMAITFTCYAVMSMSISPLGLVAVLGLLLARPVQIAHLVVYTQKLVAPGESATIMSVRRFVFMTFSALGSLTIGLLASHYGLSVALFVNGTVGSAVALWSLNVMLQHRQRSPVTVQS